MRAFFITAFLLLVVGFAYYSIFYLFDRRDRTELGELPSAQHSAATSTIATTTAYTKNVPLFGKKFSLVGTPLHPAKGFVEIVENERDVFLNYVDMDGINGPDLYIYLSKDKNASMYVSLGPAKAIKGNTSYLLPKNIALTDYPFVMMWSERYDIPYNYAEIKL